MQFNPQFALASFKRDLAQFVAVLAIITVYGKGYDGGAVSFAYRDVDIVGAGVGCWSNYAYGELGIM
jgi:hypothetical protein